MGNQDYTEVAEKSEAIKISLLLGEMDSFETGVYLISSGQ